jgi:hypothetical protein
MGSQQTKIFLRFRFFATGETGFAGQFAEQQSRAAHVRFGSKADIGLALVDVRFTPESGHCLSLSRLQIPAKLLALANEVIE